MRSPAMDDFVAQVRAASDIRATIAAYVPLKQKGRNYWGCCPFHQEKTPSFSVTADKGFFYCFGCHVGGDVFKFLSLIEGVGYFDAIKLQAERLNIPLPQREKSPEELKRDQHLKDLYRVAELGRDFFHSCLTKTSYGKEALAYLAGRGIGPEIIEEFKLGFAPQAPAKLLEAFRKRGIPQKLLLENGLISEKNGRYYDRFRNRFIIPIADERGRVVAFGGRVLDNRLPKYLNSPETVLFNKRRLLFGLDRSHQAMRQEGYGIIVEGYMDAISLFAAGVKNVAASLGTAFTLEQCRLLLRYAPELYFCYDSDAAGQNATLRALEIVKETGARVKVLVVPDGKDPDEFVRRHGVEAFRALTKTALPVAEYQLQYVLTHYDYRSLEGKAAALQAALPVLKNAPTVVEQNAYLTRLAHALGIDEGIIRGELKGFKPPIAELNEPGQPLRPSVHKVDTAEQKAGRSVLRQAWKNQELFAKLLSCIPVEEFPDKIQGQIFARMEEFSLAGRSFEGADFVTGLSEEAQSELSRMLVEEAGQENEETWELCLKVLRKAYLQPLYERARMEADALDRAADPRAVQKLAESMQILKEMQSL